MDLHEGARPIATVSGNRAAAISAVTQPGSGARVCAVIAARNAEAGGADPKNAANGAAPG